MPFKVVVKPNQLRQNRSKKRSDKINFGLFYRFFKVITKNEMLFQWPPIYDPLFIFYRVFKIILTVRPPFFQM